MTLGKLRVTIVDMQPITPAVGGGRQRLLGLYHGMGPGIEATYVGTYDWPGEAPRDTQLTPGLREICVPLGDAHFEAAARLSAQLNGATVIDSAFAEQAGLSPEFLRTAREHIAAADVVVFTHPWCFPPLADALRAEQLVAYDAQNVEIVLKAEAFQKNKDAAEVLRIVAASEQAVLERSDIVLACSDEDTAMFRRVFDADPYKLRIVPNGAFTARFADASTVDRLEMRATLDLPTDKPVALFLGSMYGPNVEAARYIVEQLAPACPAVTFVVAGGVGQALVDAPARDNVIVTGSVDDKRRDGLLLSADVALNPMFAGSGTNIKMFDYMAAGLPVLSTVIGARGIGNAVASPEGVVVSSVGAFPEKLAELLSRVEEGPRLRLAVQRVASERYSWERISEELGKLLSAEFGKRSGPAAGRHRVAMFSTWNVACGIGEHASYMAEAMAAQGSEVLIVGNSTENHEPLGFERDLRFPVSRAWLWDNKHWRDSRVDLESTRQILDLARPSTLFFQHHTGFVNFFDVEAVVSVAAGLGIRTVVEMHDGRNVPVTQKNRLCELGAHLLLHHEEEKRGMGEKELARVSVMSLPVRAAGAGNRISNTGREDGPIVAGFGFLRPYKGVLTAVRVLHALRKEFPSARYAGWHAAYGEESERHLADCRLEAERLGVQDAFAVDTGFHSYDDVVAELRSADVILMAYGPSAEGSSAAVNMALSAARPIVVSPSEIFSTVSDAVHVVARHEISAYVDAVAGILRDRSVAENLSARAERWAEDHSYYRAAQRLLADA